MERSSEDCGIPGQPTQLLPAINNPYVVRKRLLLEGLVQVPFKRGLHDSTIFGNSSYNLLPHPKTRRQDFYTAVPLLNSTYCSTCHNSNCDCKSPRYDKSSTKGSRRGSTLEGNEKHGNWECLIRAYPPKMKNGSFLPLMFSGRLKHPFVHNIDTLRSKPPRYLKPTLSYSKFIKDPKNQIRVPCTSIDTQPKVVGKGFTSMLDESMPCNTFLNRGLDSLRAVYQSSVTSEMDCYDNWMARLRRNLITVQWTADGRYIVQIYRDLIVLLEPYSNNCERKEGSIVGVLKLANSVVFGLCHNILPHLILVVEEPSKGDAISPRCQSINVYDLRYMTPITSKRDQKIIPGKPPQPANVVTTYTSQLHKISAFIISPCGGYIVMTCDTYQHEALESAAIRVIGSIYSYDCSIHMVKLGEFSIADDYNSQSTAFSGCGQLLFVSLNSTKVLIFPVLAGPGEGESYNPYMGGELNTLILDSKNSKNEDAKQKVHLTINKAAQICAPMPYSGSAGLFAEWRQWKPGINTWLYSISKYVGLKKSTIKRDRPAYMNKTSLYVCDQSSRITAFNVPQMTEASAIGNLGPANVPVKYFSINCSSDMALWSLDMSRRTIDPETDTARGSTSLRNIKHELILGMGNPMKPLMRIPAQGPIDYILPHPCNPDIFLYKVSKQAVDGQGRLGLITLVRSR